MKIESLDTLLEGSGSIGELDVVSTSLGFASSRPHGSEAYPPMSMQFPSLDVHMRTSVASPLLMMACLMARNLGRVILTWRAVGNEEKTFLILELHDLYVTHFNQTCSIGASPTESAQLYDHLILGCTRFEMECGLLPSSTAEIAMAASPIRAVLDKTEVSAIKVTPKTRPR